MIVSVLNTIVLAGAVSLVLGGAALRTDSSKLPNQIGDIVMNANQSGATDEACRGAMANVGIFMAKTQACIDSLATPARAGNQQQEPVSP